MLNIKDGDHEAIRGIANCYKNLGSYRRAIEYFKKAVELKPDDTDSLYRMGILYNKLYMKEKALEVLKRAKEISPDDPAINELIEEISRTC